MVNLQEKYITTSIINCIEDTFVSCDKNKCQATESNLFATFILMQ